MNPLIPLLSSLMLMALSPLLLGLELAFVAWMQGRPRSWRFLFQPYRDLWKLARITPIRPDQASWLFAAVPALLAGVSVLLLLALPVAGPRAFLSMSPILLIYLLALHRFLLSLGGVDGDAPFGGLGGARTMFLNFVTEINFFLWLVALILYWWSQKPNPNVIYLDAIIQAHGQLEWQLLTQSPLLLLSIVLGLLILYELERIPVGDPASHLELTMAEKGIALAWQGRDLALVKGAEMLRLGFFMALFALLFLPGSGPGLLGYSFLLLKILVVMVSMTVVTNTRSKLRLTRMAAPAFFAGALSLLSIVLTISFHLYLIQ